MPLAMLPTKSLQHCQDQMIRAFICYSILISRFFLQFFWQCCDFTNFFQVIIEEVVEAIIYLRVEQLQQICHIMRPFPRIICLDIYGDLHHPIHSLQA